MPRTFFVQLWGESKPRDAQSRLTLHLRLVPPSACGDLWHALCRPPLSKMARNRTVRQSVRQSGAEQMVYEQALFRIGRHFARPGNIMRYDQRLLAARFFLRNPHGIERAIDEDQGDQEEENADSGLQRLVRH